MKAYALLFAAAMTFVASAPSEANITYRFDGTCTGYTGPSHPGPIDLPCTAFANQSVEAILVVDDSYVDSSGPCHIGTPCLFKSFDWIDYLDVKVQTVCDPDCHDVAIPTNKIFTVGVTFGFDPCCRNGGGGALPAQGPANFFTYVGEAGSFGTGVDGGFFFRFADDLPIGRFHEVSGVDGVWTRVDEPTSLALLGIGLAGLAATRRRKLN